MKLEKNFLSCQMAAENLLKQKKKLTEDTKQEEIPPLINNYDRKKRV